MKRFILTAALAASLAFGANAQDMFDSGKTEARFGARIGWDLSSASTDLNNVLVNYNNGSGLNVGGIYNIPLYKNLYFEPGLSVYYDTYTVSPEFDLIQITDHGNALIQAAYQEALKMLGKTPTELPLEAFTMNGSLRNFGFRVPMIFGYTFDFTGEVALAVYTGPQFNVGLSMKEHLDGRPSVNLYNNNWRRVDAQWLFGVRFLYTDNWFAEIGGGVGMTNLLGGDAYKGHHFRRNMFTINVGYLF